MSIKLGMGSGNEVEIIVLFSFSFFACSVNVLLYYIIEIVKFKNVHFSSDCEVSLSLY